MAELRQSITSDEMTYWLAVSQIDGPFLPQRLDALAAIISTAAHFGQSRPDDWLPKWEPMQIVNYKVGAELFAAWAAGHNKRLADA